MKWLEKHPLPEVCKKCQEEDCYNCDFTGERWYLTEVDELQLRRRSLERAIERMQQQIAEIDNRIEEIEQALEEPNVQMTQEIWGACLWVCIQAGDTDRYNRLWNEHLDFADNMMREAHAVAAKNPIHFTEGEIQESLARFKARMREEHGEDFI